jgi:eukaryotic-like serine/threonine-protein kinase
MPLAPGLEVTPTIRLARLLKQGGMGSVWAADHLTLRTEVAVKFMSPELVEAPAAVARFSREATAAAQIKSPHVVQILDHGLTREKVPYIVMELLEGEELGKRIKRLGPLGLKDASKVLVETARALGKAHGLGIVHRDIKPDNVFLVDVDGEPFVKVLDFGIAKHRQDDKSFGLTSTGSMVGTPYYMSPEQLLSAKHVDLRSDLWSLGIVTYRMLTGRVPFKGETLGGLCVAIEKGVFPAASSLRPGLSAGVDRWFERALARMPEDRFGSAREMADAFVAAISGAAELPQMSPADVASMRDPFTPNPGSEPRVPSVSFTPMGSGDARPSAVGPFAVASTVAAHGDVALGDATGPSAPPTFAGASRTSPGVTSPRARSTWLLMGVFAGLAVGGLAATYLVVTRANHSVAVPEVKPTAAPAALPSERAPDEPAKPAPSVEAAAPAPEPSAAPVPAPSAAPITPVAKNPSSLTWPKRSVAPPPPSAKPAAAPPPQPEKPKERDRGF